MDYDGDIIVQSMFFRGTYKNEIVDNTVEEEILKWLRHIESINPVKVMIYSIDRDTPAKELVKVSKDDLEQIAQKVRAKRIECEIA